MVQRVVGVGNTIMDIFCEASDDKIHALKLNKGAMNVVTNEQFETLKSQFPLIYTNIGGSVLNSIDSLAKLGMECTFISTLGRDINGTQAIENMKALKVNTDNITISDKVPTSVSLIMVTPDGQRTMCTMVERANILNPSNVPMSAFLDADAILVEGYLLDDESSADAAKRATDIIRSQNLFGTITLCDYRLVTRHRNTFHALLKGCAFCAGNTKEYKALLGVNTLEEVVQAVKNDDLTHCITLSEKGAVIVRNGEVVEVPPYKVERVIDTTGAGDQFLAGFILGRLRGANLMTSGRAGAIMGGSIVEQIGGNFHRDMREIITRLKKM